MELEVKKTDNSFSKFLLIWSGEFISIIGSGISSFGLGFIFFNRQERLWQWRWLHFLFLCLHYF